MKSEIFFIPVHDNAAKLKAITNIACEHFKKRDKFLILVADKTALHFIDQLLWRVPEESFLPHLCIDSADLPEEEYIFISEKNILIPIIFNLCPLPCFAPAKTIYELEDFTSPDKEKLSKERYDAYRTAHHPISLLHL
jgi:DNA polymerase IIIc chi subunit